MPWSGSWSQSCHLPVQYCESPVSQYLPEWWLLKIHCLHWYCLPGQSHECDMHISDWILHFDPHNLTQCSPKQGFLLFRYPDWFVPPDIRQDLLPRHVSRIALLFCLLVLPLSVPAVLPEQCGLSHIPQKVLSAYCFPHCHTGLSEWHVQKQILLLTYPCPVYRILRLWFHSSALPDWQALSMQTYPWKFESTAHRLLYHLIP